MKVCRRNVFLALLSITLLGLAGCNSTEDNDYNYSDSSLQQNQTPGQTSAQE